MRKNALPAVVAVLGALLAGCGSAAESTKTSGEKTSSVVSGGQTSSSAIASSSTATSTAPESKLAVSDFGFTQLTGGEYGSPGVTYAVIVENPGSSIAEGVQLQVSFESASGSVIATDQQVITAILPGTRAAQAGYKHDIKDVATMKVQMMPGRSEALKDKSANFTVDGIASTKNDFGMKTVATVTSPFTKDLKDVLVTAVYRDGANKIVGGDFTFLNFVPAGGNAAVTVDSINWEGEAPAATEVYATLSALSLLGD